MSSSVPRVRPVKPGAVAKREAILNATEELIAAHGVDALEVQNIALRAGVSVGTFYRYFENKHAVLQEIHPEFTDLASKVQALRDLSRESIPDGDKWLKAQQIFNLE